MFTGIVEHLGTVAELRRGASGARLSIAAPALAGALRTGDSIAVNGVCLTATDFRGDLFACDLSEETLRRTTFPGLRPGAQVNLEQPLEVGERLGGHFVLGHVDGVGTLLDVLPSGTGCTMRFRFPSELARYLVPKGSIAVDGISLTLAELEAEAFAVAVIPHTLSVTNLGGLRAGARVNLEADVLGKYVERCLLYGTAARAPLSAATLKEQGC